MISFLEALFLEKLTGVVLMVVVLLLQEIDYCRETFSFFNSFCIFWLCIRNVIWTYVVAETRCN
jgi:hypothetical protein